MAKRFKVSKWGYVMIDSEADKNDPRSIGSQFLLIVVVIFIALHIYGMIEAHKSTEQVVKRIIKQTTVKEKTSEHKKILYMYCDFLCYGSYQYFKVVKITHHQGNIYFRISSKNAFWYARLDKNSSSFTIINSRTGKISKLFFPNYNALGDEFIKIDYGLANVSPYNNANLHLHKCCGTVNANMDSQ